MKQTFVDDQSEDPTWRRIVVEAMAACVLNGVTADRPPTQSWMVEQLVRAGFNLTEVREHFDDVKRRLET